MNITKNRLRHLPTSTGIYLLKDKIGETLYIGKAKNLRSRIFSYLNQEENAQRPHIAHLMREVQDVEYVVTNNERAALLLENSLIKQKKPKYNIRLKDDKNYLSLRLDIREAVPRLALTRRVLRDGALYYGPFTSADAIKKTKRLIHKVFPLRDCTDEKFRRHSLRPCLNYYMKQCLGPCTKKSDDKKYRAVVEQVRMFLKGEKKQVTNLIKENMERASEETRFEDAAHYRDQLRLLEKNISSRMFVTPNTQDMDVVGLYRQGHVAEFAILFLRGGSLVDREAYSFTKVAGTHEEILEDFLSQFYGSNRFIPNKIIIPFVTGDKLALSQILTEKQGRKVSIEVPKRGERLKLANLANINAAENFQRKSTEHLNKIDLLKRIKSFLHLPRLPVSIECCDISNIQGSITVASIIRFENGEPVKDKYKRFRIKTVKGPDDYSSMHEALSRRFARVDQDGWEAPDLMLIDGGKGQLNIAHQVLDEIGYLDKVGIASIAKGKEEGEVDKVYMHCSRTPAVLSRNSHLLLLLMRIRDEAHRFAITYHKKLRSKETLRSELDGVPGIGIKRKRALIKRFGSISKIREASVNEIASVPGVNERLAENLKNHLSY